MLITAQYSGSSISIVEIRCFSLLNSGIKVLITVIRYTGYSTAIINSNIGVAATAIVNNSSDIGVARSVAIVHNGIEHNIVILHNRTQYNVRKTK
jgi:hypothetical protein